jgi:hypothetical protein
VLAKRLRERGLRDGNDSEGDLCWMGFSLKGN